mmetsp:Transcript_22030/g.34636  ORF Transcript_22030/g.34636 Transcript_22030/m.34636 type:complete len:427 (-) Transcript_22030:85-1365(-)
MAEAEIKYVFVSGVHHSGTGFLRHVLHASLNGSTVQKSTKHNPEGEAMWSQSVYGTWVERIKDAQFKPICGCRKSTLCLEYTCPGLRKRKGGLSTGRHLLSQWHGTWTDPEARIRLIKDPDLMVPFRLTLFRQSAAVVIIRHPLSFSLRLVKTQPFQKQGALSELQRELTTGYDIHLFMSFYLQVLNEIVETQWPAGKVMMVRYEDLASHAESIGCKIAAMILNTGGADSKSTSFLLGEMAIPGGRRLNYHLTETQKEEKKISDSHQKYFSSHRTYCQKDKKCRDFMNAEPFFEKYGYSFGDYLSNLNFFDGIWYASGLGFRLARTEENSRPQEEQQQQQLGGPEQEIFIKVSNTTNNTDGTNGGASYDTLLSISTVGKTQQELASSGNAIARNYSGNTASCWWLHFLLGILCLVFFFHRTGPRFL